MIRVAKDAEQPATGMVQLLSRKNHRHTEISMPIFHEYSFCRYLGLLRSVDWTALSKKAAVKRQVQQASNKQAQKLAKNPVC